MTRTLKGRVVDGKIELLEPLDAPDGTAVDVTLEVAAPDAQQIPKRPMRARYGMFAKPGAPTSTEADWEEAKRIWEPRDR